jgi:hypothetical protein
MSNHQNIGTLVSAAIRPNSSLDRVATAFANEIKGGQHGYATITERDSLILERREWGMLVTVYNDNIANNNKTYQLKYGYVDTNILNNSNWIEFGGSSSNQSNEWVDSVLTITTIQPTNKLIGNRFLVGLNSSVNITGSNADGNNNNWSSNVGGFIAEWVSSLNWKYTFPTNGLSLRVDNEDNSIYRYEGIYPNGTWVKEMVNQVVFLNATTTNGINYTSASSSVVNYNKEVVYLVSFSTTNISSSTLNINSYGNITIKKIYNGILTDLVPSDIIVGIVYTLIFDGTFFQISISDSASSSGVIGPAEDGTYNDGLFTDFNDSTPVGTAVDRFNEILKSLVPPPAPILSDWSGSKSGTVAANGKLSFDNNFPISGFNYISATSSTIQPVAVDGLWSTSTNSKRLGISPENGGDVSGVLNNQVVQHNGSPIPAYVAKSFGDAEVGSLILYINGVTASTTVLTNLSSQNTTIGNSISGFILSAATASKFPGGDSFDTWMNRTGTWLVKGNDSKLVRGYNYIQVVHNNTPSFVRTLNRYEFIIDHNTTSTVISDANITSFNFTGNKFLSGIEYFTNGNIRYDVTIDNLYRNTYYSDSNAISFNDNSGGLTAPILNVSSVVALANSNGNTNKQFKLSNSDQNASPMTFSVLTSGKRRHNESVGLNLTARRTIQGNTTGGSAAVNNVFLDNVSITTTTDTYEDFVDERFRLKNTSGLFQYDSYSIITSNIWQGSQSLIGGVLGWTNGLQVVSGVLKYPNFNYSDKGTLFTNLNFGNSSTNYTNANGNRVYIRYFRQVTPTTGNFIMKINGTNGNFVPVSTALTGNNIHVEIKAPGLTNRVTGWLDTYSDFATDQWNDGSGSRFAAAGLGRQFGLDWGLTIGTKNTADTFGYILVRITTSQSFIGEISNIDFKYV